MTIRIVSFNKWLKHAGTTPRQEARTSQEASTSWREKYGYHWEGTFGDKESAMIHAKALDRMGKSVIVVRNAKMSGYGEWWEVHAK